MISIRARDLENYRKFQQRRINRFRRLKNKTPPQVAQVVAMKARQLAPMKSGELIRGIRTGRTDKGAFVRSSTPPDVVSGIPYNLWINENIYTMFIPKQFRPKGMKRKQYFAYAEYPTKTGSPRYFTLATEFGRKLFPKKMKEGVKWAIGHGYVGMLKG